MGLCLMYLMIVQNLVSPVLTFLYSCGLSQTISLSWELFMCLGGRLCFDLYSQSFYQHNGISLIKNTAGNLVLRITSEEQMRNTAGPFACVAQLNE